MVSGLSVTYPDRTVLSGVDLLAQPGRRIGLVGENGVGKSTLLRAVAGRLPARARVSGSVTAPDDLVLLGQEPPFRDTATVADVLAMTLAPLRTAVADVERLAALVGTPDGDAAYGRALEAAIAHDAWDADRRAEVAAARLGLADLGLDRVVGTLSGGQRTRLALATIMTTRPSCLLLDEPTNHLDDDAIEVLTGFLRDLPGVVVLASHDRVLLDDVCTDLVDLDAGELGTDGKRRPPLRRRLVGLRGRARRRPPPLGGDLGRAAGGDRAAARRHPHRHVVDRPRPRPDRRRQVHLLLQGRARGADPRPAQEGRPAPARGRRARAGAQAAGAARLPRPPDGRGDRAAGAGPRRSRSPGGCGWSASTSRQGSTCC